MIFPFVRNEFSQLQDVVLGISNDFGGCPNLKDAYDPKSKEHIMSNTFPREKDIPSPTSNGSIHKEKSTSL